MTSHNRSYGEELQRGIFVQIASAIGDLESAIGITSMLYKTWAETVYLSTAQGVTIFFEVESVCDEIVDQIF